MKISKIFLIFLALGFAIFFLNENVTACEDGICEGGTLRDCDAYSDMNGGDAKMCGDQSGCTWIEYGDAPAICEGRRSGTCRDNFATEAECDGQEWCNWKCLNVDTTLSSVCGNGAIEAGEQCEEQFGICSGSKSSCRKYDDLEGGDEDSCNAQTGCSFIIYSDAPAECLETYHGDCSSRVLSSSPSACEGRDGCSWEYSNSNKSNLGGETCESQDLGGGTLECDSCSFDTSACEFYTDLSRGECGPADNEAVFAAGPSDTSSTNNSMYYILAVIVIGGLGAWYFTQNKQPKKKSVRKSTRRRRR
jgi:hypothetical protein